MKLRTACIDIVLLVKLVIDDSLCTLYKHVVMLFYIFSLGGRGSRKKRYVTKKEVSNQVLQAVA